MSRQSDRGKAGEQYVSDYLADRGWRIEARNYRIKGGEIDIVASKDGILAFVEVKTRKFGSLTDGTDAITRKKQGFVIRAADRYIQEHPGDTDTVRFDAAIVTVTTEELPRVLEMEYLENAFDAFSLPNNYEQF